jgi:hypothetical protein
MRTSFGFCIFAGVLILIGASLAAASPSVGGAAEGVSTPATPAVVHRANFNNTGIRDEAAMVLVGTILIGLAGAVRRAA